MPETPFFAAATSRSTDEVTGNTTNGHGIDTFAERLSGVYVAATLALKPGAPFVFTYHHNDRLSYAALVVGALDAGLVPITTLACPRRCVGPIHINASKSSRVDSVFVLRKPPVQEAGDRNVPFTERLREHVQHLIDAGLRVSIGDQRCIRYGLVAEEAMRALAPTWDSGEPIESRMELARSTLTSLDEQEPAGELFEVDPPQEEAPQLELVGRPDELPQRTTLGDEFVELFERIDVPVGCLQYPLKVSWPMREAPAIDDRDYLPPPLPLGTFILIASQRLEARSLVTGSPVVFGQLGLDDHLGEVGSLGTRKSGACLKPGTASL